VCRRFLSVPGVGLVIALTYATGIDDSARFAQSRDIGPHFTLTPRKYASGEAAAMGLLARPVNAPWVTHSCELRWH
jgi:transposase